tara:strand:- start:6203 stop:6430 length:228 start_codon:yes stop_codon:yes gene_type:complete
MIPDPDHWRIAREVHEIRPKPVFTSTAIGLNSGDNEVEFGIDEGEDAPLAVLTTGNQFLVFKIIGDLRYRWIINH